MVPASNKARNSKGSHFPFCFRPHFDFHSLTNPWSWSILSVTDDSSFESATCLKE